MNKISCIAIDDEPLALGLMVSHIKKTPFLELVAQFDNPIDAMEFLETNPVQLLFLDIQMPDLTGVEFARILKTKCRIVFTTAYDKYAMEGFEVEALDYILKPISYSKFLASAQRANRYFDLIKEEEHAAELEKKDVVATENKDCLFVKADYQIRRIDFSRILYLESAGDYVKLFLGDEENEMMCHTTMKAIELELPKNTFMRIHRSFIVNVTKIQTIENNRILLGKERIPISKQYKPIFDEWLKLYFLKG